MDKSELIQYIHNADSITPEKVEEVKSIVVQFPCFHAALLLYLKGLWVTGNPDFIKELDLISISVPNRRVLYTLLKGDDSGFEQSEGEKKSSVNTFDLIDAFLAKTVGDAEQKEQTSDSNTLKYEALVSIDYLQSQMLKKRKDINADENQTEENAEMEQPSEKKLKRQDLIDSFLSESSTNGFSMRTAENTNIEDETTTESDIAVRPLEKSYFTETLARIYIKQKRYDKALQIIKNLNLKFPEKNIYFADQIRYLEKLIINTKK